MKTVVLIGCSGPKLDRAAPARDLYTSALFKKCVAYAEALGAEWAVLSAKHGLVQPDQVLAPYDCTFKGWSKGQLEDWGRKANLAISERWPFKPTDFVFLGGEKYAFALHNYGTVYPGSPTGSYLPPIEAKEPLRFMQIGQRLAWLNAEIAALTTHGPKDWNRCPKCRELVDLSDPCFDGHEAFCCDLRLVVTEREDGSFDLRAEPDVDRRECDFCGEEKAVAISEEGHATPARPEVAAICERCAKWALVQLEAVSS